MTDKLEKAKSATGYLICLLAFVFVAWSFYPGLMTADSVANLSQGRADVYGDINAPLMSWLWGRLDAIIPGPALIFLIHLGIFWTAIALLWKATYAKSLRLGLALAVFGLMPHILAQTVVVWKDVALGVSLLMAVALIYHARSSGSRIVLLLTPLFIFYGYAARLNALPAVLPIAIWFGFVAVELFEIRRKRLASILIGLACFGILSLAVYFVNQGLTDGRTDHPFQQVYLYDLAAISIAKNESQFPEYVADDPNFSFEVVRARYNERSVADLIFPDLPNAGDRPPLKLTGDSEEVRQLRNAWIAGVANDPIAYLRHRCAVFAQLIGLSRSVTAPYVERGFDSNPAEYRGGGSLGYGMSMKYFSVFRRPVPQTLFFRAVVWIVLCCVLIYIAVRRRFSDGWDLVFVLCTSSVLFIAAYFPTTPSTEFRYLFWPAIASAVATIFGFYLWWNEPPQHAELATQTTDQ